MARITNSRLKVVAAVRAGMGTRFSAQGPTIGLGLDCLGVALLAAAGATVRLAPVPAYAPAAGQIALVRDEGVMLVHDGGWQALWPVAGLRIGGRMVLAVPPASVAAPSGGTSVDAEARASLAALIAALQAQGLLL